MFKIKWRNADGNQWLQYWSSATRFGSCDDSSDAQLFTESEALAVLETLKLHPDFESGDYGIWQLKMVECPGESAIKFQVDTFLASGELESRKNADWRNNDTRKWFVNHMTWALNNSRIVEIRTI